MKKALGIAVSGSEIRVACLTNDKGHLRVEELEIANLKTSLESHTSDDKKNTPTEDDSKDIFGVKDDHKEKDNDKKSHSHNRSNLEVLYGLLQKYTSKKIKVALNVPISRVHYNRHDVATENDIKKSSLSTDVNEDGSNSTLSREIIHSSNGSTINLEFEPYPPSLSLLREVNEYLGSHLSLALMEPTEMALVNLARTNIHPEYDKFTTIIYIEDDFTRLIFLKGRDFFHVSSIIHANAGSPNILNVVYRKLIYEQDEAQIPKISKILLAGRCSRIDAKQFFKREFSDSAVGYLCTSHLGSLPIGKEDTPNEVFSEYAVPIALAWKQLQPKNPIFYSLNLLPQEFQDQQKLLKLDYYGYALLAITGFVAFFFTWQYVSLNIKASTARLENSRMELQINSKNVVVDEVLNIEQKSMKVERSLILTDSLSRGHDEFLNFLTTLNKNIKAIGHMWVDELSKQKDGYWVKGTSLNRDKIPLLAEELNGANLISVTRAIGKQFYFELECPNFSSESQITNDAIPVIKPTTVFRNSKLVLVNDRIQSKKVAKKLSSSKIEKIEDLITLQQASSKSKKQVSTISSKKHSSVSSQSKSQKTHDVKPVSTKRQRKPTSFESTKKVKPTVPNSPDIRVGFQPATFKYDEQQTEAYIGYTIVAATKYTSNLANAYAKIYRKQGLEAAVESYYDKTKKRKLFRVLIGSFVTRPAAAEKAVQLAKLFDENYSIIGLR